ncbi:helix-turn-helix domain-containing protein [Endozoicomonas atrinae]|uniref:helix-turn-helix domain-containing protein n=1 Tax=Endozoicomonas atrinae TaxID=1333660 RepID=UPI00082667A9|nr:helix-turn-helix transcriptional regulator [Endozoicomonas atrinae]
MELPDNKPWENLYRTRESASLTQTQMGFLIGTSSSQYGKIEAGHISMDLHRIRICHLLGVKWPQLNVAPDAYHQQYLDRAVKVLLHRLDSILEVIGCDADQLDDRAVVAVPEPLTENAPDIIPRDTAYPRPDHSPIALRIDAQGQPVLIRNDVEVVIQNTDAPIIGLALKAIGGTA